MEMVMETMTLSMLHIPLSWVLILYAGAFAVSCTGWQRILLLLLAFALVSNALIVLYRYSQAWPMLPMHLAPVLTPCLLASMLLLRSAVYLPAEPLKRRVEQLALLAIIICLAAAQLFPKDFYLPFLRSDSLFAHIMLFAGAAGRVCFIFSLAWSITFFTATVEERSLCMRRVLSWAAWGFVLWTLSMFSGEMWAYLGWGTPVIWHDPAILLMMAVWFIYIALLHLHFSRTWGLRARALFAAAGGCAALVLSLLADFGPFRPLW